MNKYWIVINDAEEGSWSSVLWSEISKIATVHLDNNNLKSNLLRKIKKIHFSNTINRRINLPLKCVWDNCLSIKISELNTSNNNYVIFQSNVKFSPRYIKKLKNRNAKIVLYLPDTVEHLGIACSKAEFKKYCDYYLIDKVYSFDPNDCSKYDIEFFDLYSSLDTKSLEFNYECIKNDLFYIGNARTRTRVMLINELYEYLCEKIKLEFIVCNVDECDKKKYSDVKYNKYLSYNEIVKKVNETGCILEIINTNQSGNTLRFKEAVVYNKKLLTNNRNVFKYKYYDSKYMQYFDSVENIDVNWILNKCKPNYNYMGDYSPKRLIELIASL